ncbi:MULTISPECIES: outer membrane protein assembly factor BamB [unclassified Gilliamella]|uniref:outer membrane protein assembly factor BamB n=1 Tax=unclassified Gilliamella TaxID=2685620 RepID=UPI002269F62C|nr:MULTISPECIES: outer membrane protein assembly factor BamB [unclassified Gilliamella]MCX8585743.1 outer membrane protein assembly factor BamB [Gilliamella sp. B3562]MCX8661024.1 outer membrane protein assembly factor BamB [Gilliamella sp. B2772]MCX8662689.1 outer membrane protein assembly factor BamB [Gilliamella sp. B2911]MCX8674375.1 outer membrane protein assembly factor BamB [Gilliamella sp. B3023]MCX8683536.1 outer membrane protein assembly factor BamB [Gilliamella sp. B2889]
MKLTKCLSISVFMFSLAGCSLFGGEEEIVQVSPSPKVSNQFSIKEVWRNSTSGNTHIYSLLGPINYDNAIYAASRSGQVKAIDLLNGHTIWDKNLSKSTLFSSKTALFSGGVSADDKYVYVGSERAVVYALDRNDGNVIWEKPVKGEVLARPISSEDKLIVYTASGNLQALNRNTGEDVWDVMLEVPPLSLRGNSTPTIAHGAAILGDDTGHVNAYYLNDGQLIWQQRISQPSGSTEIAKLNDVDSTPVIEGNLAYAIGYNGNVVALDLSNGQIVWRKEMGSTHSFAVDSQHLFVVDQDDNVQAVSKNGGTVLWTQADLLHRQLTDPVLYENYIVLGDFEGYLYWLSKDNGEVVAKTQVSSSGLISKPLVVDNKVIVQAKNGDIYAFTKN